MSEFKQYRRIGLSEMRPYVEGEDLSGVSVSDADKALSTLVGGYIARNPKNHADMWYVAQKYFEENLEEVNTNNSEKTLTNTTAKGAIDNVKDIQFWGNGDTFLLVSKASSQKEGWMKSTKALPTRQGCCIQVTTQQRNPDGSYSIGEALSFAPVVTLWATIQDLEGNQRTSKYYPGGVLGSPLKEGETIVGRYLS